MWIVHFAGLEKWTNVHESTAIVCACLPLYKPLMVSVSQQFEKITTFLTSISHSTPKNSQIQISESSHSNEVCLGSLDFKDSSTRVTSSLDSSLDVSILPKGSIVYSRTIDVV